MVKACQLFITFGIHNIVLYSSRNGTQIPESDIQRRNHNCYAHTDYVMHTGRQGAVEGVLMFHRSFLPHDRPPQLITTPSQVEDIIRGYIRIVWRTSGNDHWQQGEHARLARPIILMPNLKRLCFRQPNPGFKTGLPSHFSKDFISSF